MIGVVMAGGRGSRMRSSASEMSGALGVPDIPEEKLLLQINSHADSIVAAAGENARKGRRKPVVAHVIDTLAGCDFIKTILAVTSSNAPRTKNMLLDTYDGNLRNILITDSAGAGYSEDLAGAIRTLLQNPDDDEGIIVVSGDMPLLDTNAIANISNHYVADAWTSIVVSKVYSARWDMQDLEYEVNVDGIACYYTGVSVVGARSASLKDGAQRHAILDDHRIAFTLNTVGDYERLCRYDASIF